MSTSPSSEEGPISAWSLVLPIVVLLFSFFIGDRARPYRGTLQDIREFVVRRSQADQTRSGTERFMDLLCRVDVRGTYPKDIHVNDIRALLAQCYCPVGNGNSGCDGIPSLFRSIFLDGFTYRIRMDTSWSISDDVFMLGRGITGTLVYTLDGSGGDRVPERYRALIESAEALNDWTAVYKTNDQFWLGELDGRWFKGLEMLEPGSSGHIARQYAFLQNRSSYVTTYVHDMEINLHIYTVEAKDGKSAMIVQQIGFFPLVHTGCDTVNLHGEQPAR